MMSDTTAIILYTALILAVGMIAGGVVGYAVGRQRRWPR